MGYLGQWIELWKKKTANKSKSKTMKRPESSATFKRGLPGLQHAGLYLN